MTLSKEVRRPLSEMHLGLLTHIENMSDQQPWDNAAMFNKLALGLNELLMEDLNEQMGIVNCPRTIHRGGYQSKPCEEKLKDYVCPKHGLIREVMPK